ncbi:putative Ig domain-containing protein [Catenulispora acidiphila]
MSSEVANDLVASTKSYQVYPSGLAAWNPGSVDEPYIEQISNVAATLDEAFATDYDGTVRFAPAWPSGWDGSGRVYIQGGSKVDVQVEGGVLATAAIEAGSSGTMSVRNPWSGQQAQVVNGSTGAVVVAATNAATLSVPVTAGQSYLVEQPATPTTSLPFAQVTGTAARGFRQLGSVSIGLGGNTLPAGNTVTVTSPGSQSGTVGTAISALQIHATDSASGQTLSYSAAGLPPGLSISSSGLVSGTPSASGTFTVTVTATDSTGASGAASFTWTVGGGSGNVVSVTNPGSQSGTVGTAISGLQIQGTDSAGQTLTYTAGGLPTGLSISSSGLISGTPSASGTFTVTVTATDSTGASGAASFTWTISGGTTGFPGGYHSLVVAKSSLCLDVFGNTSTAGAAIDQYTCNSQSNQQFQFLPIANGYGELQAQNSGQDVTVANSSTAQGTPDIVQQPVNGAAASLWLPQQQSDGSWQFKNQNSGLCLDVYGNGSTTGQQLDQWPCKNAPGTNQDFNPR